MSVPEAYPPLSGSDILNIQFLNKETGLQWKKDKTCYRSTTEVDGDTRAKLRIALREKFPTILVRYDSMKHNLLILVEKITPIVEKIESAKKISELPQVKILADKPESKSESKSEEKKFYKRFFYNIM